MICNHPTFLQPDQPATPIWRYLSLSKFVSLIQRRALYFARADNLGDPFEGSYPRADSWSDPAELNRTRAKWALASQDFDASFPDQMAAHEQKHYWEWRERNADVRRRMTTEVFVSCWHLNVHESDAMWRLYSSNEGAVALRTEYGLLAEALPSFSHMGLVRYLDYKDQRLPSKHEAPNYFEAFLVKRASFSHENEVRAVIWDKAHDTEAALTEANRVGGGLQIPIEIERAIQAVYISPLAPHWFNGVITDLLRSYQINLPVRQSDLLDQPSF